MTQKEVEMQTLPKEQQEAIRTCLASAKRSKIHKVMDLSVSSDVNYKSKTI